MPTPYSLDQIFALQPEPTTGDFGINVGEKILEKTDIFSEPASAPRSHCNIGSTEQKIRLATGGALVIAAAFAPVSRGWRIGLAAFGASQLVTGAMSYCPLWHALGIDTRREEEV
jgi:hypothetical protein